MYNNGEPFSEYGWQFFRAAEGFWKVFIVDADTNRITMTGSDVTTELHIPFPHRFDRFLFYHVDSSNASNQASLDILIKRLPAKLHPNNFAEILNDSSHTSAKTTVVLPFSYEASLWQISLNTTTTHFVYPIIYVWELEK